MYVVESDFPFMFFILLQLQTLSFSPWLAAEIPDLVARGVVKQNEESKTIVV